MSVQFLLVCQNSWKPTFVSSLTMAGIMAGAFFLGPLPDMFVFQFHFFFPYAEQSSILYVTHATAELDVVNLYWYWASGWVFLASRYRFPQVMKSLLCCAFSTAWAVLLWCNLSPSGVGVSIYEIIQTVIKLNVHFEFNYRCWSHGAKCPSQVHLHHFLFPVVG